MSDGFVNVTLRVRDASDAEDAEEKARKHLWEVGLEPYEIGEWKSDGIRLVAPAAIGPLAV